MSGEIANDQNTRIHFKNLDGLRAIAAFAVIFYHISTWFIYPNTRFYDLLKYMFCFGGDGGDLGVYFFFILSGFLITYLLFVEQAKNNTIHIPFFYFRRVLRIWPLYYSTLIVGFFIYPLLVKLSGGMHTEQSSFLMYAIFAANFDHIYNGIPSTGILGVHWSVAIEEQFYLLWPVVIHFLGGKKIFPFLLLAIIVSSELFFMKASTWSAGYFHLFSNFRFLASGGLLAYICYFHKHTMLSMLQKLSKKMHLLIYALCLSILFFKPSSFYFYRYFYEILPFLFFGFVIMEQIFSKNSFFKIGAFPLFTWLGKISYGLYLTHMIAIYIVMALFANSTDQVLLKVLLTVSLAIGMSYLSYRHMESFFLSFKDRFSLIHTSTDSGMEFKKTEKEEA